MEKKTKKAVAKTHNSSAICWCCGNKTTLNKQVGWDRIVYKQQGHSDSCIIGIAMDASVIDTGLKESAPNVDFKFKIDSVIKLEYGTPVFKSIVRDGPDILGSATVGGVKVYAVINSREVIVKSHADRDSSWCYRWEYRIDNDNTPRTVAQMRKRFPSVLKVISKGRARIPSIMIPIGNLELLCKSVDTVIEARVSGNREGVAENQARVHHAWSSFVSAIGGVPSHLHAMSEVTDYYTVVASMINNSGNHI